MSLSILELAANVRQKQAEVESACSELRHVGGEWTDHSLMASDAMNIADSGLRNCWAILERTRQMANEELKRLKAQKGGK